MTLFRDHPELLSPFRRGEKSALESVYWAYVERIERIVRGGWRAPDGTRHPVAQGEHDVADLVQEIFARVFGERARLGFDGLRPFAPYLDAIARNLMIDWARRGGREITGEVAIDLAGSGGDDAEPWADAPTIAIVEAYVSGLSPELGAVHRERYVLGRSQRDAAAALGISRQQLRTREQRLRDGLRERLAHR